MVSAGYENNKIQWISVKSETGASFVLKAKGINQLKISTADGKFSIKPIKDDETSISLQAGASITLKRNKETVVEIKPTQQDPKTQHSFGVKKGQQLPEIQDYQVKDFHEDM